MFQRAAGAIRGLGEKFRTNPANGTATLTIPVPLSKSRSGFQPALALSYNSGSGNGPFGLGWTLGLPSISRRTDKGVPRYVPFARHADNVAAADAAADIFLLSGSEDLVPVTADDAPWAAYREVNGYFVRAFRPRIEGTFSRIESWTRIADGDTHWRTISPDNILTVYGETLASRIADPEDTQRIFEWLICRSYDDRGNAIAYDYAAEGGDGVDVTRSSERLRVRSANRYLKRIRYGNRRPVLLDVSCDSARRDHLPQPQIDQQTGWLFEVVLDYGDEPFAHEPEAEGSGRVRWTEARPLPRHLRPDSFSRTRAGFEIRTHRLCQRILMAHRMPERLGTARTLVRDIQLDYDARSLGTRLARVTQSGYRLLDEGSYRRRSLPALLLDYTPSPLAMRRLRSGRSSIFHAKVSRIFPRASPAMAISGRTLMARESPACSPRNRAPGTTGRIADRAGSAPFRRFAPGPSARAADRNSSISTRTAAWSLRRSCRAPADISIVPRRAAGHRFGRSAPFRSSISAVRTFV